jgi:hypothetical protein
MGTLLPHHKLEKNLQLSLGRLEQSTYINLQEELSPVLACKRRPSCS